MAVRADLVAVRGPADGVDLERDRDLVLRYQGGDDDAFDELYRRYFGRLRGYCQRRVGDRHTAEELAQEAFLRALQAMPRFAGDRRFYPWMTVIAHRLCIDHHRRNARVEPAPEVDPGAVEQDHADLFAAPDRAQLVSALDRLAPRHREVLDLREVHGWSYQHIADHLDVPVTTVEALLHRARKALRREFLSVAGGGRIAALPVVGWAVAGVAKLRTRAASASQLVAPAAATVAAVGLAVGPLGLGRHDHQPAPTTVETVATVDAVAVEPLVVAAPVTAPAPASVAPAPASAPAAAPTPPPPPPSVSLGAGGNLYLTPEGADDAERRARDSDVTGEAGPIVYGANPDEVVHDVVDHVVPPNIGGSK
jgi:RNA polymerase sigma-70 factor (ECF subfamily)